VAREKNDVAAGEPAGEKIIGGFSERGLDLHPFLMGKAFDGIKSAAADDADFVFGHGGFLTAKYAKYTKKLQVELDDWRRLIKFHGWRSEENQLRLAHGTLQ
jgi:hypothetical protein